MKVLQINSVCGIRSTGRICTDIAILLERQGHTCKIVYGRERVPQQYQKYAHSIATLWDNRIDALRSRIFDNAGLNSKAQTKRFVEWMEEYNPDVIHLHNLHGYYINVEVLFQALKRMDKPVIWTFHDCWPFTGHCSYFELQGCEKWKTECHSCPLNKKYPASFGYDRSRKNYWQKKDMFTGIKNLTIVTPSEWLASLVRQSYLREYDVRVIRNGINLSVFQPTSGNFREEHKLENKKIVLGVAAVWTARKGLHDLFELAKKLGESYQVVIVGLIPKQTSAIPDNVTIIARTNDVQQLAHVYTTADVLVNPTYEDNYPTVNLEAQACGTPVITYRTGGSVESVPEKQIIEQGDLEGLSQAIRSLENCVVLRDDFSSENCFQKYIELYANKAGYIGSNQRMC